MAEIIAKENLHALAQRIISVRQRCPENAAQAIDEDLQPINELSGVKELKKMATLDLEPLEKFLENEIEDLYSRQQIELHFVLNPNKELAGLLSFQRNLPLNVMPEVQVAAIRNTKVLKEFQRQGYNERLKDEVFEIFSKSEGVAGVFSSMASKTEDERRRNARTNAQAASKHGFTRIIDATTSETYKNEIEVPMAEYTLQEGSKKGTVIEAPDLDKSTTFVFKKL
eukprot:TRINITY_DN51212_c0_g1_i1.p1 TRINITY_DN51212_c0_g1~~TRINITY_DN51212_c0_g1_i1.p1  ORF type:complete len:226 (+),score=47.65 TRINITY_DN51212_c0_g1_i1:104-781(+)